MGSPDSRPVGGARHDRLRAAPRDALHRAWLGARHFASRVALLLLSVAACGPRESATPDRASASGSAGTTTPAAAGALDSAADLARESAADVAGDRAAGGDPGIAAADSVLAAFARLRALEDSLARSPADPRAPGWLLRAGRIARAELNVIGRGTPEEPLLRARPDLFYYNEVGGDYLYGGAHFDTLLARFPADSLADDAAYERWLLILGGECEGFFTCYLDANVRRAAEFLEARPGSPFSLPVTAQVDTAVRSLLAAFDAGELSYEPADSTHFEAYIRRYESATARLSGEAARVARGTITELRKRRPRGSP